jgi:hypothetical protein
MKIEHGAVVAQRLVKLLFAGDLFGDIKLAADLRERIKQRDLMPAGGGVNGKGQTGRPAPTTASRLGALAGGPASGFHGRRAG